MDRKQLEQLIREALAGKTTVQTLNEEEQAVKAQIRQAIVSAFDGDQVAEDIDHPEKVQDPEGKKAHDAVMTPLDEAKLSTKVRAFVKGEEEERVAPYYKEHLHEGREKIHEELMKRWCKKGKK